MTRFPSVRPLDIQPVYHQGQRMWLLRDPLGLSDQQLIMPPLLAHMLRYLDGNHDLAVIQGALLRDTGVDVPHDFIRDAIENLDLALLLENERSAAAKASLLANYQAQRYRPAALAGLSYPAEVQQLTQIFDQYAAKNDLADWPAWQGRGIVSPHIDYQRGGPVYAQTWRRSAAAVLAADLVIILGTDHNGPSSTVTLTHLPYATPFGVLPTDDYVIDQLAEAIGCEAAFADELHHRKEHSIELSAVWLHSVFAKAGQPPCPMIPVLVGSFHDFLRTGTHPSQDQTLLNFVAALQGLSVGKRVLVIASVDLAHVGPAFSDGFAMDTERRTALRTEDEALMAAVLAGDASSFYDRIAGVDDRNRICGFAPLYLMLSYLGQTTGINVDYQQCPADDQDKSFVSICGLLID